MSLPAHWKFDGDNDQWVRDDGVVVRCSWIRSERDLAVLCWEVDYPWAWVENRNLFNKNLREALGQVDTDNPMPSWLRRAVFQKPGWDVQ